MAIIPSRATSSAMDALTKPERLMCSPVSCKPVAAGDVDVWLADIRLSDSASVT